MGAFCTWVGRRGTAIPEFRWVWIGRCSEWEWRFVAEMRIAGVSKGGNGHAGPSKNLGWGPGKVLGRTRPLTSPVTIIHAVPADPQWAITTSRSPEVCGGGYRPGPGNGRSAITPSFTRGEGAALDFPVRRLFFSISLPEREFGK